MKSAFLVLLLIFTNGIAFTQVESYSKENPSNLKPFVVNLIAEKIAPQNIKLPFSRISIIYNRYDTSKIGFRESFGLFKGKKNSFKKIVLKKGMSKSFEDYYNDFYDKNFTKNGFELVLVFKKFWWSYFGKGNSKKADYALYNPDFLQVHTKCSIT